MIRGLLERDAVIGIVPFNGFLQSGWRMTDARHLVDVSRLVAQIDYICQMAGDARHVGLGTDFDGGFGVQHVPPGIDTIADLQKLGDALSAASFNDEDIKNILGGNWLRVLRQTLPE